jgi:hypothetical protein
MSVHDIDVRFDLEPRTRIGNGNGNGNGNGAPTTCPMYR